MLNLYSTVEQLTSSTLSPRASIRLLNDFAAELGWKPSDHLDVSFFSGIANAHLVVEHGLENSAVITFLQDAWQTLDYVARKSLLNISYNNLVDWHIQVQSDRAHFIYNRTDPPTLVESRLISPDNLDSLRSEAFEQITGKRPNPNVPALDDALIKTISSWKRNLVAEMGEIGQSALNEAYSALFNAIIFVRAAEDQDLRKSAEYHFQRATFDAATQPRPTQTLLGAWNEQGASAKPLRVVLRSVLERLIGRAIPDYLFDDEKLRIFDELPRMTVAALLNDFYRNKYAPYYSYDFSLISKHALSRIYEQYVSILRFGEADQPVLPLFSRLPEEQWEKSFGSIYTPQYIARFFARYLREQMPPLAYKRIRTVDPACGSGIFLRTLLELQCDPMQEGITTGIIDTAFRNVLGLDVDGNAVQATVLSLSLLHLVLTDDLPEQLNIVTSEAIEYYQNHPEVHGTFDAVIANPPYVSLGTQSPAMRQIVTEFMGGDAAGRIDIYLAFLRIGLDLLKPGGYGLFVIPHSFLLSKAAANMRKRLFETSWIRCLADLSEIPVFKDSGAYVILLVFQKRPHLEHLAPVALIIKCKDFVGHALQDALAGVSTETNFYSIYEEKQTAFGKDNWIILPPTEASIMNKFEGLPTLGDFLNIHQGFISGADDIFIVPAERVPPGEEALFVPFLPDRDMKLYTVPEQTPFYFFSSFIDGRKISEEELVNSFPGTWKYLVSHKSKLESRPPVRNNKLAWWQPERPRQPKDMMRPKIISPHLVLVPRFSLDRTGKYAVSRTPFFTSKDTGAEDDLLQFFVAVLNSSPCYWYIATHSHKYQSGYAMLEPKTLKTTPVPDPTRVDPRIIRRLLKLVESRLLAFGAGAIEYERQIDMLVADLYGLSTQERRVLGMEE
jgi:methylase of polypeptide subunit release factors